MTVDAELLETIRRVVDERLEPLRVRREEHEELRSGVRSLEESHARVADELAKLAAAQRETQETLVRFEARAAAAQVRTEEAQARTEEAQARTEKAQARTEEAQARTEEAIRELFEAQTRTEEAQARTDASVHALSDAQARTERALGELADVVKDLAVGMKALRREVGGLSERLGSDLEEMGRIVVAEFLREQEGIELPALEGRYLQVAGEELEVDLFGEGRRGDEQVIVIGECKARVMPREMQAFRRRVEAIAASFGRPIVSALYCQRLHPEAERIARQAGVVVVPWSYQHRIWAQGA